jgi:hypothetical protein
MRILIILALIFCFGCSDDDFVDSEAGIQEAGVMEASVDAQPVDVGSVEAVVSDAQSE